MDEERKNEEREKPKSLHKDGRVWGLIAVAAVAGFLIAMVFYGKPWHLPPAWGDVPTWLLAAGAAVTAWLALLQLRDLRDWIARNAERDSKRDDLLDKQLEEAERRARSERRQLVEGVEVTFTGTTAYVDNNSKRPINDLTCRIMSKVDRVSLASAAECGEAIGSGLGRTFIDGTKPVSRFETLRPGATCGFTFGDLTESPDQVLVAWFTDDDEFRWQLDQYQHLVDSGDESVPADQDAPAAPAACSRCHRGYRGERFRRAPGYRTSASGSRWLPSASGNRRDAPGRQAMEARPGRVGHNSRVGAADPGIRMARLLRPGIGRNPQVAPCFCGAVQREPHFSLP